MLHQSNKYSDSDFYFHDQIYRLKKSLLCSIDITDITRIFTSKEMHRFLSKQENKACLSTIWPPHNLLQKERINCVRL